MSTDDDDDDVYGSSSGSSSGGSNYTRRPHYRSTPSPSATGSRKTPENGTVRLIKCADAKTPYATVQVSNPNNKTVRFDVHVAFLDTSPRRRTRPRRRAQIGAPLGADSSTIRAWARDRGYDVPERGRIPAAITTARREANGACPKVRR